MASESTIMSFLKENPVANRFVPYSHMNQQSDCLTVYFEGDADYSERLSDHVTLYRSLETKEVVGCRIRGISGIIEDLPNYIHINHGGIQLSFIFFAFRGNVTDKAHGEVINNLARNATEKNLILEQSI